MEKSKRIFVDSNYFIALFNPQDILCKRAEELSQKIYEEGNALVFSNFIFLEVVTVLSQKKGRSGGIEAGIHLLGHPFFECITIDEGLQQETWKIFEQVKHKDISFVDCSVIACMKAESITELLTFDTKDFRLLQKQFSFRFYH